MFTSYCIQKSWIKLGFGGCQSKKAIEIILNSNQGNPARNREFCLTKSKALFKLISQPDQMKRSKAPVSQLVNADDTSVIEIKTQLYLES